MANPRDLVAVMAELHEALTPGDLTQTLSRVTDAAVTLLPGVDGATITVEREAGGVETAASTGSVGAGPAQPAAEGDAAPGLAADTAARLDYLQQALDEGPAVDVVDSPAASDPRGGLAGEPGEPREDGLADAEPLGPGQAPTVTTSDLSRDERYPAYGVAAVSSGVRAQAAIVLFDTDRARGVLNLYSQQPGAFEDMALLTDLFAHHSATALAYAAGYHDHETAVSERRAVGQALGIVMERFNLSESKALALLQQTAMRSNISVRLVAQELVARTEQASSSQSGG